MTGTRHLLTAAALFLVLIGCRKEAPGPYASPRAREMVGSHFPAFALPDALGTDSVRSSSLAGKPSVVVFWATWCPSCLEEMKMLKTLPSDTDFKGVGVVLLSVDDPPAGVRLALPRLGVPYPVGIGASPLLASFQLDEIPQTFVLDTNGVVRSVFTGEMSREALLSAIQKVRAGK